LLPNLRAGLAGCAARYLAQAAGGLACCLPDALTDAAEAFADTAEPLTDAAADLADRTTWPERLAGGISQAPEGLARSPARLDRLLSCLTNVTKCLADGTPRPERLVAELADGPDGVINRLDKTLEDFRVTVECR